MIALNEKLTWEVIGFDDELVKLNWFEFDIPIQTNLPLNLNLYLIHGNIRNGKHND